MATRARTVEREGMAAVAETVATNGTAPSFRERAPDDFAAFVELLWWSNPVGYAAQCRALVGLDLEDELGRITAPALLVCGDRDGVAPPDVTRANAARMPNARAVVIEDAAHILTWERPDEVEGIVRPFLLEHAVE
jgi:pimeloyl-ACP methyl ester carboxylesterase